MEKLDDGVTRDLVNHFRDEAATYRRQWTLSLGIGCGAAAIAVISLAANLPDPNYAFRLFAPSLWLFLAGIVAAAGSLPVAALRSSSMGEHYAASFNRDQYQAATRQITEYISSPKSMAERMNAPRNELVRKGNKSHDRAEQAWRARNLWNGVLHGLLAVAAVAFVVGVALPLIHISTGGFLAPASAIADEGRPASAGAIEPPPGKTEPQAGGA